MREKLAAACDSCGRTYRVPDASKTYNCKACEGGRVRVLTSATPALTKACASCGETLQADANFCVGCGSQVTGTQPAKKPAPRSSRKADTSRAGDKRRASMEIMRWSKRVNYVRRMFMFFAVYMAIALLGIIFLGSIDGGSFAEGLPAVLSVAAILAVTVAGVMNMRANPLPWVIGVAGLWTLKFALGLAFGGMPNLPSIIGSLIKATLLWGVVIPALRLNKLVAKYPDLYAAHRVQGTKGARMVGGTESERVEHGKLVMREAAKKRSVKTVAVVVAIFAFSLLGSYLVHANSYVPGPEESLEDFASAWASNDADAVAALTTVSRAPKCRKRLVDGAAAHKWRSWPPLIEVGIESWPTRVEAEYDIGVDSGNMHVHWKVADGDWVIASIAIPTPELGKLPQRFRGLWNDQNLVGIAELFRSGDSERTASKIKRMLAKRSWDTDCPKIESYRKPQLHGPEWIEVPMQLDNGEELSVVWKFEDGRWRISKLKPPAL